MGRVKFLEWAEIFLCTYPYQHWGPPNFLLNKYQRPLADR